MPSRHCSKLKEIIVIFCFYEIKHLQDYLTTLVKLQHPT